MSDREDQLLHELDHYQRLVNTLTKEIDDLRLLADDRIDRQFLAALDRDNDDLRAQLNDLRKDQTRLTYLCNKYPALKSVVDHLEVIRKICEAEEESQTKA